ncbi:hypothetical protein BH20ACT17_BH20ACT17_05640 [soil metagenome]
MRRPLARLPGLPELWPWLLLSVSVAVVATGLGLVAYAAFMLPGPPAGASARLGTAERTIALLLALAVPVGGIVAARICDATARLPSRRERRPPPGVPLLALALAAGAGTGWALIVLA